MFIVKFQIHWNKQFQTHLKTHLLAILVGKEATKLAANITSGTRATIEASFGESYYFFMSVCSFLFLHVCIPTPEFTDRDEFCRNNLKKNPCTTMDFLLEIH